MNVKIYRVEHPDYGGYGPYHVIRDMKEKTKYILNRDNFNLLVNELDHYLELHNSDLDHPMPTWSKAYNKIEKHIKYTNESFTDSMLLCGFINLHQFKRWFDDKVIKLLYTLNFRLNIYSIDERFVYKTTEQAIFYKYRAKYISGFDNYLTLDKRLSVL